MTSSVPVWDYLHASVGINVAGYFPVFDDCLETTEMQLFPGKVIKFMSSSSQLSFDQIYHIQWNDGEFEDYSVVELTKGMNLYDGYYGWLNKHESIGWECAAYLPTSTRKKKTQKVHLHKGTVVKCKSLGVCNNLYRVQFNDKKRTVMDFNESQLQLAMKRYERVF